MFTSSPKTGRALRDDKENWREGDWVTKTGKRKERIILSSTCSGFEGLSGTPAPKLPSSVPPPPPRPRINHAFFEQYPGASFASLGILDFRLIVTSYVSRCVSWHPLSQKKAVAEVYSFWRWVGEISLLTAGKATAFNLLRAGYLVDLVRKKGFKPQQIGRPFPWPKPKRWKTSSHFGHETTAPPQNHLKRVWIRYGLHTNFDIWAQDKVSLG